MMVSVRSGGSRGFTLIEVAVAVAVVGVLFLGASAMVEGVARGSGRAADASRAQDREVNGLRLIRQSIREAGARDGDTGRVSGTSASVSFPSWCDSAFGWREPCPAELRIEALGTGSVLVLERGTSIIEALRSDGQLALRYLADADEGGRWESAWSREAPAPLAIGIVIDTDTLIAALAVRQ